MRWPSLPYATRVLMLWARWVAGREREVDRDKDIGMGQKRERETEGGDGMGSGGARYRRCVSTSSRTYPCRGYCVVRAHMRHVGCAWV